MALVLVIKNKTSTTYSLQLDLAMVRTGIKPDKPELKIPIWHKGPVLVPSLEPSRESHSGMITYQFKKGEICIYTLVLFDMYPQDT